MSTSAASVDATDTRSRLYAHVRELTRRYDRLIENPEILGEARRYVESQIEQMGLEPLRHPFDYGRYRPENVYCRVGPQDRPVVILGAHYDGHGEGANDNATGVAVALEVLRGLKATGSPPPLVVAFFAGEEAGLIGSRAFARALGHLQIDAASMLNLDMLGDGNNQRIDLRIASGGEHLAQAVKKAQGRDWPLDVRIHRDVGCASDDYSFASRGIPAAMLISDYLASYVGSNRCARHTTSDTFEGLDFDYMGECVDLVTRLVKVFSGLSPSVRS